MLVAVCREKSHSASCNPLGCGSVNVLHPDPREHEDTEQYCCVLTPKISRGGDEGICLA